MHILIQMWLTITEYLHKYSALEILERINSGEKTELIDPVEGDKPLV
jgi:hypothetical protein